MAPEIKNSSANAEDLRDVGSVPGLGRSAGGGNDNPLQYSCLENSMQRSLGATVHGLAKGQTWLKRLNMHTTCDLYFLLWDALPFKLSFHPSKNVLFKIKVYQRKVTCYQKNLSVISKPGNRHDELFCFEQCIRLSSTSSLPIHSWAFWNLALVPPLQQRYLYDHHLLPKCQIKQVHFIAYLAKTHSHFLNLWVISLFLKFAFLFSLSTLSPDESYIFHFLIPR